MSESSTPKMTAEVGQGLNTVQSDHEMREESTQEATLQAVHEVSKPLRDLDGEIRTISFQIQLVKMLSVGQRSIDFALAALNACQRENFRRKQLNLDQGSTERLLETAQREIDGWIKKTRELADQVDAAGKKPRL